MQRYDVWKNKDGSVTVEPHPRGDFVKADEAIEQVKSLVAVLKMVLQHGRIDDSESRMSQVAAAITKAESTGHL